MISHGPASNGHTSLAATNHAGPVDAVSDLAPVGETAGSPAAAGPGVRWPAERFYWAVLDAPVRRAGPLSPGLLLDLQEHVPVDVSELHAVGAPLAPQHADGPPRTLVCAAARAALLDRAGHPDTLVPTAVPAGIAPGADTGRLNLLVGEFEPRATRRRRARAHAVAMVGTIAVAMLITLGLSRRSAALEHRLAASPSASGVRGVSPSDLRMLNAFTLRAVNEPAAKDVTASLAAMLRAWPSGAGGRASAEVQSLSVDARRIALTVSVDGDPGEFLATLAAPRGFVMGQPGIGTSQSKARLALTFTPTADPSTGVRP